MNSTTFLMIALILLALVLSIGMVISLTSNMFKDINGEALKTGKNDKIFFWMILIGFTLSFLFCYYIYNGILEIRNMRGPKGEPGEKGETGEQGPPGRCENCN